MNEMDYGLRLKVDTSESQKFVGVAGDIDKTTKAARESSAALGDTSDQVKKLLDKYDPLGAKLRQLKDDFNAMSQAARTGSVGLADDNRYDLAMGKIVGQMKELQSGGTAATAAVGKGLEEMAVSAERGMFATAGARRELIVLGHEALTGNFARMPGSFLVLAERIHLSGSALALMGVTAVAVVAPIIALMKAVSAGTEEMNAMNRAIENTSNFAGQTRGTMRELAMEMASTGQITIGQSKDVVTALVASGRIGAEALGEVSRLAADYARATGQEVKKLTPELVKLFSDPAKAADELNRTMHFLTASERDRIEVLQQTSREGEAQLLLAQKLKDHLAGQTEQLGLVERAWRGVKGAAANAWDAMLGLGRGQTLEDKLAEVQRKIDYAGTRQGSYLKQDVHMRGGRTVNPYQQLLQEQEDLLGKINSSRLEADQRSKDDKYRDEQNKGFDLLKRYSPGRRIEALEAERSKLSKFGPGGSDEDIARLEKQKAEAQQRISKEILDLRKQEGREAYDELRAQLEERAKLVDQSSKAELDKVKRSVTLHLESEQDGARKSYDIEMDRVRQREELLARQFSAAERFGDKRAMAQVSGEMAKLAQGLGEAYLKMGDEVAIADQKVQQANLRISLSIQALRDKFAQQNEAVTRTFEVLPEGQRKLRDALEKVDQEGKRLTDDIKKQYEEKKISEQTYRDRMADANQVIADQRDRVAALNEQQQALNASWEYGAQVALQKYLDNVQNASAQAGRFMTSALQSAENAWVKWATTGKLSIKDLFNTLEQETAKAAYNKLFAPLVGQGMGYATNALGGLFGFGGGYNPASAAGGMVESADSLGILSMFGYAKGDVFDSSSLHRYANTILSSPTLFRFAQGGAFGMAGEAGPEAVMPLTRGPGGSLGVKVYPDASSSGGNRNASPMPVRVELINQGTPQQATSATASFDGDGYVVRVVTRDLANDGPIASAMRDRFGANRAAGAY